MHDKVRLQHNLMTQCVTRCAETIYNDNTRQRRMTTTCNNARRWCKVSSHCVQCTWMISNVSAILGWGSAWIWALLNSQLRSSTRVNVRSENAPVYLQW